MNFVRRSTAGYTQLVEMQGSSTKDNTFFPIPWDSGYSGNLLEEPSTSESATKIELRSRGGRTLFDPSNMLTVQQNKSATSVVSVKIEEGDTLQKIALKYGVPISELKRANGLMNEQGFYALSLIKIPVSRYSHVEELLTQQATTSAAAAAVDVTTPSNSMRSQVAEDAASDTSELIPLSDAESPPDWENLHKDGPNLHRKEERLARALKDLNLERMGGNQSPTSVGSNGSNNDDQKRFDKIIRKVDATIQQVKTSREDGTDAAVSSAQSQVGDDLVFSAINGDSEYLAASRNRNQSRDFWWKKYAVVVLVLAFVVVPLVLVVYFIKYAPETKHRHSRHSH